MSSYNTLGTLVGSALLAAVALFIFCRGFLLTRTTYTATSTCHSTYVSAVSSLPNLDPLVPLPLEALFPVASSASSSCNGVPALVDSLSVIVVDALRFDFAAAALPLTIPSSVSSPAAAAAAAMRPRPPAGHAPRGPDAQLAAAVRDSQGDGRRRVAQSRL